MGLKDEIKAVKRFGRRGRRSGKRWGGEDVIQAFKRWGSFLKTLHKNSNKTVELGFLCSQNYPVDQL